MTERPYNSTDIETLIMRLEELGSVNDNLKNWNMIHAWLRPFGYSLGRDLQNGQILAHNEFHWVQWPTSGLLSGDRIRGFYIPKLQELQEAIEPGSSQPKNYAFESPNYVDFAKLPISQQFSLVYNGSQLRIISKRFPEISVIFEGQHFNHSHLTKRLTNNSFVAEATPYENFLQHAEESPEVFKFERTDTTLTLTNHILDRTYRMNRSSGFSGVKRLVKEAASDNSVYEALKHYGFEFERQGQVLYVAHADFEIQEIIPPNAQIMQRLTHILQSADKIAQQRENGLLALTAQQNYRIELLDRNTDHPQIRLTNLDYPNRYPPLMLDCFGKDMAISKAGFTAIVKRFNDHKADTLPVQPATRNMPQAKGLKPINVQTLFHSLSGEAEDKPALVADSSALINLNSPRRTGGGTWLGISRTMASSSAVAPLIIVPASSADYAISRSVITRDEDGSNPRRHSVRGFTHLLPEAETARLREFLETAWRCFSDKTGNRYLVDNKGNPVLDSQGKLLPGKTNPGIVIWETENSKTIGKNILNVQEKGLFAQAIGSLRDYEYQDIIQLAAKEIPDCSQLFAISRNYEQVAKHETDRPATKGKPLFYITLEHALQAFDPLIRSETFRDAHGVPRTMRFTSHDIIGDYFRRHEGRKTRLSGPFESDLSSAAALSNAIAHELGAKATIQEEQSWEARSRDVARVGSPRSMPS